MMALRSPAAASPMNSQFFFYGKLSIKRRIFCSLGIPKPGNAAL